MQPLTSVLLEIINYFKEILWRSALFVFLISMFPESGAIRDFEDYSYILYTDIKTRWKVQRKCKFTRIVNLLVYKYVVFSLMTEKRHLLCEFNLWNYRWREPPFSFKMKNCARKPPVRICAEPFKMIEAITRRSLTPNILGSPFSMLSRRAFCLSWSFSSTWVRPVFTVRSVDTVKVILCFQVSEVCNNKCDNDEHVFKVMSDTF